MSLALPLLFSACAAASRSTTTVTFHEASFELPDSSWKQVDDRPGRLQFAKTRGRQRATYVSIWPVPVPLQLRGLTPAEHAAKYLELELNLLRARGRLEEVVEGTREIAGRRYPVVTFRTSSLIPVEAVPLVDVLFLLYFPDDFAELQRFYTVMWQEFHPTTEPAGGLEDLDAIISTLRVRSRK